MLVSQYPKEHVHTYNLTSHHTMKLAQKYMWHMYYSTATTFWSSV